MCNYRILILLFTYVISSDTLAQNRLDYSFRHINQSDGLLHNQVFSIAQDSKGFVWIATSNGLQRYDGSRFIYYPDTVTNPAEGPGTGSAMYADKKNNLLWILKLNAIGKMDLNKNRLTLYSPEILLKDTFFHFSAYSGSDNTSWLVGENGVYQINKSDKKIIARQQNILPPGTHKTSYIATDQLNKQIWVTILSKAFLFDEKTKKVYAGDDNPENHPLLQSLVNSTGEDASRYVMTDSKNNIWVTTWGDNFYRYDPVTNKVSTYHLSAVKSIQLKKKVSSSGLLINCITEDDQNIIWIGTENTGLLRFNRGKDDFDYCTSDENKSKGIQYNYKIFSIFQDKEQNIWIGTDKGINIFNPYREYFQTIRHEENNIRSLPKSEIISFIQATNGDIFIGTWGNGLSVYDSSFHFKKNIVFKGASENNFIWDFQQIDTATLWIGCQHGYLVEYNMVTGATQYLHPPEMEGFTIRCMEKDKDGNIFFGLQNGKIVKWTKKEKKFLPFGDVSFKNANPVLNIFIDPEQRCWVSTEAGLKEFDLNKRIYTNTWLPDKNNSSSISGRSIQGIEMYNDSTLLIATTDGGLNFFNKKTKKFTHLTRTDKLQPQTIYAVKKDAAGYIWFTTDYGLFKFNPAEKKLTPYNMGAGVITSSFTAAKFYPLKDAQWLTFTTTETISFFPQKKEYNDNLHPKIEMTGFKVFDKPIFIDSLLAENKPVRLSYKENFLTIEFAALSFSGLQQTTYYYRLNGIDKDWVNAGTKRFANYTDLQPGEYTFDVKAETGNSSGETTSFVIVITPPFWKTVWFKILCLVVIAGILYAFTKWRINTIREQEKRKMLFKTQMAEMEMRALRSQMNPHFIFNCINSIDALIQSNDKYHATVYLNKFAKLLRNILDTSKQNTVLFSKDIETLKLYVELEELRHENKFNPEFKIDHELLNSDYKVPPLIVQPFVENAILHGLRNKEGNEGILTIEIKKLKDKIQYKITDNGIGREASGKIMHNKESHYGMQMSYDRIKLFNKEETVSVQIRDLYSNEKATGTEVTANLNII